MKEARKRTMTDWEKILLPLSQDFVSPESEGRRMSLGTRHRFMLQSINVVT